MSVIDFFNKYIQLIFCNFLNYPPEQQRSYSPLRNRLVIDNGMIDKEFFRYYQGIETRGIIICNESAGVIPSYTKGPRSSVK
jgi:hypothetical protein